MSLKKYVEHHLMIHTIRIELINECVLLFNVSAKVKENLKGWLANRLDDSMASHHAFLCFHSALDRFNFVRISSIKRLIFCWDIDYGKQCTPLYHDNYNVVSKDEEEELVPDLVIKLRNSAEPLVYSNLDPDSDFISFDEDSFKNTQYLKGGFISVNDEDGDLNYIPVVNIESIEIKI